MFDESLEELQKAVELQPDEVAARYDLAMTYAMLGMYEEAKQGFLLVLEMEPTHEHAKKQLVYF
jgi:tetratricopeptide (TPR) repeat protein